MTSVNHMTQEHECRLVLYGPLGAGKTTCIKCFERFTSARGKPQSYRPEAERTTRLDFLTPDVPPERGRKTRVFLSTVSGWAYAHVDRKRLLERVDGVLFIADSAPERAAANEESLTELRAILRAQGREPESVPIVRLYNKRDLLHAAPLDALNAALNGDGQPFFEASAANRTGVHDALRRLVHIVCAVPDPIAWESTGDDGIPFRALVSDKRLYVKQGATLEEPLYTLIVDGEPTETHDAWPAHWVLPRVRVGERERAAAPVATRPPEPPPAAGPPQAPRIVKIDFAPRRAPVPVVPEAAGGAVGARLGRALFLHGDVQYRCGLPAGVVLVAVVAMGARPVLLGWGLSRARFSISFAREALEDPTGPLPPLHAVFSVEDRGGDFVPVHRHVIAPDDVVTNSGGLGVIVLPLRKNDRPTAVKGLERIPGVEEPRRRLRLDDELLYLAARLAAIAVEGDTGWSNLLDGIRFEIIDDYVAPVRRRTALLLERSDFDDHERAVIEHAGRTLDAFGLWSELESVVYLNRAALEQQSFAFLVVVVGHELVHVGQSKNHPELDAQWRRYARQFWTSHLAGVSPPKELNAELFGFMANLEGYADFIEKTCLAMGFTSSMQLVSQDTEVAVSAPPPRIHTELDALGQPAAPPSLRTLLMTQKSAQYDSGRRAYLARMRAGKTPPFDPALRPPPLLPEEVLKPLMKRALTGDSYSQMSLGDIYRTGGMVGIAPDRPKALRWYRLAAAAGSEEAARRLAALERDSTDE